MLGMNLEKIIEGLWQKHEGQIHKEVLPVLGKAIANDLKSDDEFISLIAKAVVKEMKKPTEYTNHSGL